MTVVDARGERCPLPVLRMEKALGLLADGGELVVMATDPVARLDIGLYCQQKGYECQVSEEDGLLTFTIIKGSASAA